MHIHLVIGVIGIVLKQALNILAAGHAVLACGVDAVATTMKQEPLAV